MIESRSIYKRVQSLAHLLMTQTLSPVRNRPYGLAKGQCADCGSTHYLVRDHRSYDDPLTFDVVCSRCNFLRGPAALTLIDVETLEHHQVGFQWRKPGKQAA